MKRFKSIFYVAFFAFLMLFCTNKAKAQSNTGFILGIQDWNQVEVGLLTCAPQQLMYGHFGHTAIRVRNTAQGGVDLAFNYGAFSFETEFFALKFLFGLTDYELGVVTMADFIRAYNAMGSKVTEQVLNLTPMEREQLVAALVENAQPENTVYRYNFFYENCTTKARDIIMSNVNGDVSYNVADNDDPTWCEELHKYTEDHPWAQLGEDLCLGARADAKTTYKERQFLPQNLMGDFATAYITTNGNRRPLVLSTRIVQANDEQENTDFPIPPFVCGLLLLAVTIGVCVAEWKKKACYWGFDVLFFGIIGIAGIIIAALFVSAHPTTSTNLHILLFNPLWLIFMPRMIWRSIRHRNDSLWLWALIPLLLFALAAVFGIQKFPATIYIIYICMLLRVLSHLKTEWHWHKICNKEKKEDSSNINNEDSVNAPETTSEPRTADGADSTAIGNVTGGEQ